MNFWEIVFGQVLALITFFAFPALQYVWLKNSVSKEGKPELWYLPDYGFRLVIRNLPHKKTLTDIKYKTYLRRIFHATSGASVATYEDKVLVEFNDFFLFPLMDQVLISFKLERKGKSKKLYFVHTSKLAVEKEWIPLDSITYLISDYTANIENLFDFDVKVAKQVRISSERLREIWEEIQANNFEQSFSLIGEVRDVA